MPLYITESAPNTSLYTAMYPSYTPIYTIYSYIHLNTGGAAYPHPPTYHNPVAIPAAMATVVAAMAALAVAVAATLAALHLKTSRNITAPTPGLRKTRLPYNNSGRLHTHSFIIY